MTTRFKITRKAEELIRFGLSKSTFYLRIQQGLIPPPVSLCGRAVGWVDHENNAVLCAMIAGRSTEEIKSLVLSLIEARKNGVAA